MSRWVARLIVHGSAWLAPTEHRARYREEWLAEFANDPRSHFRRALGAPWDALALHRLASTQPDRRGPHLGQWRNDIRYTVRLLVRAPGYVTTVVLGLGAGLTATIAMFSAVNTALYGDIPGIEDRASIAKVRASYPRADASHSSLFTIETFPIIRKHGPLVVDMAAQGRLKTSVRVQSTGEPASVRGAFASDTLFQMLGTRPVAGRLLLPSDDTPSADVVVIGFRFWKTRFGGRQDAVGQTMVVGDRMMRIVGVAPDQFRGLWSGPAVDPKSPFGPPDIWLPLAVARTWTGAEGYDNPLGSYLEVVARLAPGVTRAQAAAEFGAAARALEARDPAAGPAVIRVRALTLGEIADNTFFLIGAYAALLGMPLALLAIGCANVANLRLARATARTQELAVRVSLGATRAQLTRLLLIESSILAALAVFVSGLAAQALIVRFGPSFVALPIHFDWRVAGFAGGLAVFVIFISGLAPGWLVTRRATALGMKQTAHAGGVAHARLRHALVIAQVAISLGLLSFGALLTRSAFAVNQTRLDVFDRLLVADLDFGSVGYDAQRANAFSARLLERLNADGRFAGAGLAEFDLFGFPDVRLTATTPEPGASAVAAINRVTPGWFEAMALRPVAGRTLQRTDRDVAVLNESAARAIAPSGSAIGMRLALKNYEGPLGVVDVVGIVPDSLRDTMRPLAPQPFVYLPLAEGMPVDLSPTLYVREHTASGRPRDLGDLIASVDATAPWVNARRASDLFLEQTDDTRGMAKAVTTLALVALALAAAGLFAVMAYTVSLRTREIGIRVALGARREDITRLVVRQALRLSLTGAVIGFGLAMLLVMPLNRALLGLSPLDPLALGPVALLLVATTLAAAALPARRAASVNPVTALRAD